MPRSGVLWFGLLTGVMASGYGVMFTVLDDFRDEYGISASWLGVIVGIGFLSSFLMQVFIAPLADRGHARLLVWAGMTLNVIGLLGMASARSLEPLLLARFVMGVGVGMAYPAIRRIVVVGDPANLGRNLGLLLSADVGGFAAGPAISAVLVGPFGLPAPFLVIAALTTMCAPVVARVRVDEAGVDNDAPPARFAFDLLRNRAYVAALCMGAAVFLMIGTFDALWAIVLDDLDAKEWIANIGISLFALPLIVLGAQGGKLAQRIGPFRLGTVGLVLGAGFMTVYGFLPSAALMFGVAMVHAISDGLTVASAGVAVATVVESGRQAGAQGLMGGAETLTAGITAVTAGLLYDHFGREVAYAACGAGMITLVIVSVAFAGSQWHLTDRRLTPDSVPVAV